VLTMTGRLGVAKTAPPLFFFSFTHTPDPPDEQGYERGVERPADKLVVELFAELNRQVQRLAGTPLGVSPGYMEQRGDTAQRIADALARCRVFVPVCSPRYFNTVYCGQQWHAFTRRAGAADAIVPALWAPVPLANRPQTARELLGGLGLDGADPQEPGAGGAKEGTTSERYATEGLYGLISLGEDDQAYHAAVGRLAQRIVRVSQHFPAQSVAEADIGDIHALPDAFAASPQPRLGIAVLAPTTDRLPSGRDRSRYGISPLDWSPYRTVSGGTLVRGMTELARNLGFAPRARPFDHDLPELFGNRRTTGPWVLVIDAWALQDPEALELVRRFDALDQPWAAVMTVLSEEDPQSDGLRSALPDMLSRALPRRSTRSGPVQRYALNGVPNTEVFGRVFEELAERAGLQYQSGSQVAFRTRQAAAPGERPRLAIDGLAVHDDADDPGDDGAPEATR
jgi:FxsC-like protein